MAAYISNIIIHTSVDFEQTFILSNEDDTIINLTNYDAESKIKRHSASNSAVSFNISFPDRKNGKVRISLSRTETAQLRPGRYYYDLMLIDENEKRRRVVEGEVFVKTAVTR